MYNRISVELGKIALTVLVVILSALSPVMRELYENYIYVGGALIALFSAYIMWRRGRNFEVIWAAAFLSYTLHQVLNLLPSITAAYIGDVFYFLFYLLLFTGNLVHLWLTHSTFFFSTSILFSLLSVVLAFFTSFYVYPFSSRPVASFFNLFYMFFSAVVMYSSVRSALYDRAWVLRTFAFGVFLVNEVWFFIWLYYNFSPPDPSTMWYGIVLLAILSQKPVDRRMRVLHF